MKQAQSKEKGSIAKTKAPLPKKTAVKAPKEKFSRISHTPLGKKPLTAAEKKANAEGFTP